MKNADKFVVGGQVYDVLSPATFGDYMETIGSACINPDGYAENKLFLAYDDNVQKLFRATAAIAYSELLIKNTNCEPTTMAEALANALSAGGVSYDNTDSGLRASNVQGAIDEVNGNVETVNNDLSNVGDVIGKNGAKNLLRNTATSKVSYGVTFTVNSDGTISASGTADVNHEAFIEVNYTDYFKKGTYKLSGCPSGGGASTYSLRISNGFDAYTLESGNGANLTLSQDATHAIYCFIRIEAGQTAPSDPFKPMITLASQPNSDYAHYVPYAKTNRELTEETLHYKTIATATYDGVKTIKQLLDSLYSAFNALTADEKKRAILLASNGNTYCRSQDAWGNFSRTVIDSQGLKNYCYTIESNASKYYYALGAQATDYSSDIASYSFTLAVLENS